MQDRKYFFFKFGLKNIASLESGAYRPVGEQYCKFCHKTCKSCKGTSRFDCKACLEHGELSAGVCKCEAGYHRLAPDLACEACGVGCLRCNDRSSCVECNSRGGWARLDNRCACDFERGFT